MADAVAPGRDLVAVEVSVAATRDRVAVAVTVTPPTELGEGSGIDDPTTVEEGDTALVPA